MRKKIYVVLSAFTLLAFLITGSCIAEDGFRSVMFAILRDTPQDLENGHFMLEFSPCYYKYKDNETNDWYSSTILLKADIGPAWEISLGSDFFSYQKPDYGFSDIYFGAKWKFFSNDDIAMALTGYIDLPTGNKVFREPGMEPTLALLASRKTGDFEWSLSLGSTYASDSRGEPYYFDIEMSLELDYSLDTKNSFGVFAYGYTPDQRQDGSPRISAGASYTRTISDRHAAGITLLKGLSGRGMDWSCVLTYDLTF